MKSIQSFILSGAFTAFIWRSKSACAFIPKANVGPIHPIRTKVFSGGMASLSSEPYTYAFRNRRMILHDVVTSNSETVSIKAETEKNSSELHQKGSDGFTLSAEQKIINLFFLSAAFGYATYTILNIDSGMTRGWSASEIAMRIPLDNWGAYESYLANKPIVTKTLINVIIYLLGDWLSQTAFQGKNVLEFDISRTLRNGFIGLCFGPLVHQYYEFSDAILPPENGMVTRIQKILMDQTIYLTIKCSIYISAVGLLAGEDLATVQQSVKERIGGIVVTAWKFWPVVHCVTYSVIPAQHRILWVNSVDLVWNAILSSAAQKKSVFEKSGDVEEESSITNPAPLRILSDVDIIENNHGGQPNTTNTPDFLVAT